MAKIGAYEAKTHLPALLERVSKGERLTITKHGQPIAELVPAGSSSRLTRQAAIDAMRHFRAGHSLGRSSLRRMIERGRR